MSATAIPEFEAWGWAARSGNGARRKLSAQIESVLQKGLWSRMRRALSEEHRVPEELLPELVDRCVRIVWLRAGERAPNQLRLAAPEGLGPGSRRYATRQLRQVLLTPVDEDDLLIWYESGLGAMQRARVLRTLEQAERQGGQFQLRELAALHNLTVNATKERLRHLREAGVRLAYHGRSHAQRARERIGRLWFAVERTLEGMPAPEVCELCGLSSEGLPQVLGWWYRTVQARMNGQSAVAVSRVEGLSLFEVAEAEQLAARHPSGRLYLAYYAEDGRSGWPLRAHTLDGDAAGLERALVDQLHRRHGWSARRIALLVGLLRESVAAYRTPHAQDEILYEAVAREEPLGRSLRDCAIDTVHVRPATPEEGVGGDRPGRITDVKRQKLERYVRTAHEQSAFLTNADLCYLMGIHTDVVSRLLHEPWARSLPTRQRAWEQRIAWLAGVLEVATQVAAGASVGAICEREGLPADETDQALRLVAWVARDLLRGRPTTRVAEERAAPTWLVDRLANHPTVSLPLLARLGSDAPPRAAALPL